MTMDIADLFAPAPSGVSTDPGETPADGTWLGQILENATTLQLQTTAWQPGGPERTINAIMAVLFSQSDVVVSLMAQGGFLDFAASGTVSYLALNGETVTTPVSPDPSVPGANPDGALTWLDVLAASVYNVQRIRAQAAQGVQVFANTEAAPAGPFAPGSFHVANPTTNASYSNLDTFTIAAQTLVGTGIVGATNASPITIETSTAHGLASGQYVQIADVLGNTAANGIWRVVVLTATTFQLVGSTGNGAYTSGGTVNVCTTVTIGADVAGTSGSAAAGAITEMVTSLSGVTTTNPVALFGSNWESNVAVAVRCRARLQSLSPNGPHGSYEYFALTAITLLLAEDPQVVLSQAITRVLVQSSTLTGVVTATIANATGAVDGVSNLAVIDATNASPIEIQTASSHGLSTGQYVKVSGVLGNTAANGTWTITVTGLDTFTLDGSTGNAAYFTNTGVVEGGDLGMVDSIIQENSVPDDTTAITQSATSFAVAIVATVTLPQAYAVLYATAIQLAFAAYFAGLSIGGSGGVVEYDNIIGILYATAAGLGVLPGQMSSSNVTLNGGSDNLAYPGSTYVAALSPTPAITVVGT